MLEKELQTYELKKAELKDKYQQGFVVIKEETILGVWSDRLDAIQEGLKAYGNVSFLVKDINESPTDVINFSRPLTFADAYINS